MLVRNCLWIIIFLIFALVFLKYILHPCYGDCKNFFLMKAVSGFPIIGPIASQGICFFACLWWGGIKFIFNSLTSFLEI
jgi:hypothetical protein